MDYFYTTELPGKSNDDNVTPYGGHAETELVKQVSQSD